MSVMMSAQTVITGTITDRSGGPVAGAIVKVAYRGKTLTFAASKDKGSYRLELNESTRQEIDSIDLSARCMGYEAYVTRVPNRTELVNIVLVESEIALREVSVMAPKITAAGDTVSYNLDSFLGKSDVTLEDGLKKLPGVEVENSGTVKYQGKSISNFYIEGMDMLGGKYNLATRNMPAEYVAQIDLIKNHNDAKIDRGRVSDNVALNVRLKKSIKFKPMGTYSVSAGYNDRPLFHAEGTGMMFRSDFQTLMTLKAGNIKQFTSYDLHEHFQRNGGLNMDNPASGYLGDLSGSRPSINASRYLSPIEALVSINAMKKFSESNSLKVNASYAYSESDYDYTEQSRYFAGNGFIVFEEGNYLHRRSHKPAFELNYVDNADSKYIANSFRVKGVIADNSFDVKSELYDVGQSLSSREISVSDNFSWRLRHGNRFWDLSGGVAYNTVPSVRLGFSEVTSAGIISNGKQQIYGDVLSAMVDGGTSFRFGGSRVNVDMAANYNHMNVSSDNKPYDDVNRIGSNAARVKVYPGYEFKSGDNRYELLLTLPLELTLLHAKNSYTGDRIDFDRLYFNPSANFKVNMTSDLSANLSAGLNHSVGDAMQLMTEPVITSFRDRHAASGIMMRNRLFNSHLSFLFSRPLDYWWASASVSYDDSKNNVLNRLTVSEDDIISGALVHNNVSRNISGSMSVTRYVSAISGKISLSGRYIHSSAEVMQQDEIIGYHGNSFSISPSVLLTPWRFMELTVKGSFQKQYNSYLSVKESYDQLDGNAKLSIYPKDGLDIYGNIDFVRRKIDDTHRQNVTLFDVGARWSVKKMKFEFRVDNVFNMRRFYYTRYSGLDTHSYSYVMRPRTFVVSFSFTM